MEMREESSRRSGSRQGSVSSPASGMDGNCCSATLWWDGETDPGNAPRAAAGTGGGGGEELHTEPRFNAARLGSALQREGHGLT